MQRDDDYTFILIRNPHSQLNSGIPYITIPLDIVIRNNLMVTLISNNVKGVMKVLP